jgi:flavin reductase (DIM6/NTAB) family NADH-FMN oxidoreductase RutF
MLKAMAYPFAKAQLTIDRLKSGVFLVSADEAGKPNVMAVSWSFFGFEWYKPIFIVPVRPERFSYNNIKEKGRFVISVQPPSMDEDMQYVGTHSGRNEDKFKNRNLTPIQIPSFDVPGIQGSLLHFACEVIHTADSQPRSSHTLFFGEIVGAYEEA